MTDNYMIFKMIKIKEAIHQSAFIEHLTELQQAELMDILDKNI